MPVPDRHIRPFAAQRMHRIAQQGIETPGSPLPFREALEHFFTGCSLQGIQVHTNPVAAHCARLLHARAYAYGEHLVFAEKPDFLTLVHEVTHVLQQRTGQVCLPDDIDYGTDAYEQEAELITQLALSGQTLQNPDPAWRAAGERGGRKVLQRVLGYATKKVCNQNDDPSYGKTPLFSELLRNKTTFAFTVKDDFDTYKRMIKDTKIQNRFSEIDKEVFITFTKKQSITSCCRDHLINKVFRDFFTIPDVSMVRNDSSGDFAEII